jgi:hypothetical protein
MIPGSFERGIMAENLDILNAAVSCVIKAALLAARFSGRVRRRSLKRLACRLTWLRSCAVNLVWGSDGR